ncbi:MAG: arginine N-succinyltransferase [Gammaproteobacteria bacterium]|nr:arginine N-succinyltransferase [Gammaproteobacteria bacterium]
MTQNNKTESTPSSGLGWLKITGLLLLTIIVSVLITVWSMKNYLFVSEFTPVTLNAQEEKVLQRKIKKLDVIEVRQKNSVENNDVKNEILKPEAYSEEGAKRDINFTEKELNALLAKNTDLARKLAVDLADDLVSIKLLMPMDEDFPIFGGKTLRLKAGAEFAYRDARPVVILKGVTVMGVPVPNAWLGDIKNVDLVKEFGGHEGFWKSFSEGVSDIQIEEGRLRIKLKE